MEQTAVQKLAYILKILVISVLICNLAALIFVPFLVEQRFRIDLGSIVSLFRYDFDDGLALFFDSAYYQVWQQPYTAVLTVFLWLCGCCTAVILWQAQHVLNTICAQNPFCVDNAVSMRRAAVCCFLIAAAALGRTCWGFWFYCSIRPLLTYNALFCPIFLMAGLLCMVMSALFRQAAELKADNDLTI